ncbi:MAG: hypothetical protein WBO76_07110, partial [Saprospiraceae bacterium]
RNGTITFVESENKVYGITCWHVIEQLMEYTSKSGNEDSHSLFTMVNGFNCIQNKFIRPKSNTMNTVVDIAIRELNPQLILAIGKKALNVDIISEPNSLEFGYVVGFAETKRYKKKIARGYIISMPQTEILAEIDGMPIVKFTLHSEFKKVPEVIDYSGISGGPIFWCDGKEYGIFGIVYEGGTGGSLTKNKGIFVYGELATPSEIKYWISQIK